MSARLRVTVLGASFARQAYLPALRHLPEAEVVGIASAHLDSARSAADAFGVPHASDDWRALLRDLQPDVVAIATPTDLHAPMTLAALEAGAHVLCEKPFAMDADEARTLRDRAAALGRVGMVGHSYRFDLQRRRMRALIEAGAIGQVRHVHVTLMRPGWAARDARRAGDWRAVAERGGGLLGALASHQIDLLRWWFGPLHALFARLETMQPDRVDPVTGAAWRATADDFVHLIVGQDRCLHTDVRISGVPRHAVDNATVVYGSEGTLVLRHGVRETLQIARDGGDFEDVTVIDPDEALPGIEAGAWSAHALRLFRVLFAAVREGRPVPEGATFDDGVATQEALDAARRSHAARGWVRLAP